MKLLRITNIQRGCVSDGPGVRTTVFLKGCSLRCPWCCNPETLQNEKQAFIDDEKCLVVNGSRSRFCECCERNGGGAPISQCPFGVYELTSQDYTCEQLLNILLKDKGLYDTSGGGVTFSGGEALLQADAITPVIVKLQNLHISVAIETSLMANESSIDTIMPYVDLWIVDLKLQPEMFLHDKSYITKIVHSLKHLRNQSEIIYRLVFVNSLSGHAETVASILKSIGVRSLELLQGHGLGEHKYRKLGMRFLNYSADFTAFCEFSTQLKTKGIKVTHFRI